MVKALIGTIYSRVACGLLGVLLYHSVPHTATCQAQSPPSTMRQAPPQAGATKSGPDDEAVRRALTAALSKWSKPQDAETELDATSVLFGRLSLAQRFDPPQRIKDLLIQRQLRYENWETRKLAVWEFQYLLEDDLRSLIAALRCGMYDPRPEVREQSLYSLEHAISVVLSGPSTKEWNEATRTDVEKQRENYLDEILDLVIAIGVTDDDRRVATAACGILQSADVKPRLNALRALDRVLAKRHVHPEWTERLREMRDQWFRALKKE